MLKSSDDERTCPILSALAGSSDSTSTGSFWASRCKRDGCAWWDDDYNRCAVAIISSELRGLSAAAALKKSA